MHHFGKEIIDFQIIGTIVPRFGTVLIAAYKYHLDKFIKSYAMTSNHE